jgi:hypothetical protein
MTAYKYVARDEESRVNWGDISKTWSDAILKVEADRETKRQTIKTETDELANKLIAAPRGQHKGANEWTAQYADMQREALLDRYRQLTSGNLPLREWNSALANATQSTEQMFNLSKVYQEEYASIMERDQNLESQEAELALAAEFEGFTNFTDTVPLVDPVTLGARIGKQTYDPETGTYKVGETVTMNQMYNLLKGRYNRFDIQAATAEDIKSLGKYTTVVMDGEVKTRENWQDDPLYKEELNAKIAVHFSDPQNITSVLTNSMNSGYSPTGLLENALDKDGNVDEKKVFWVTNPAQASAGAKTPLIALDIQLDGNGNITGRSEAELDDIFGEDVSNEQRSALVRAAKKQEEEAVAFMRTYYTAEVDLIETPQAEFAPSTRSGLSATERGKYAETQSGLESLAKVFYGDKKLRQEGLDEVFGQDETITSYGVREAADGQQEIFVQQMRDDGTVVERTPIPLGEAFTQFAKPAGTQFFDAAYIDDVLPGILKKYEGRKRGSGEYTTTRQPIVTDLGSVEITYENEKKRVGELLKNNLNPETQLQGVVSERGSEATDTADVLRSVLNSSEVGMNATVAAVDERDIQGINPESYTPYSAVQIFVPNRMDKPILIPNSSSSHGALPAILQKLSSNRFVTADELLALLPEEAKAYNDPRVIASIFTEEAPPASATQTKKVNYAEK